MIFGGQNGDNPPQLSKKCVVSKNAIGQNNSTDQIRNLERLLDFDEAFDGASVIAVNSFVYVCGGWVPNQNRA